MRFASTLLLSSLSAGLLYGGAYFEPNRGQSQTNAPFIARMPAGLASIEPDRLRLRSSSGASVQVDLEGADGLAEGFGQGAQPGVSHYALQPDPASWIYGVSHFGAVQFHRVYPGVDLRYHLSGSDIEFDFEAPKPSDLSRVLLKFNESIRLSAKGDLLLKAGTFRKPIAWQTVAGKRRYVQAGYRVTGRTRAIFWLGPHDSSLPVTIDPIVDFATYLGGSGAELDTQMAVDAGGNIYMTGTTFSTDFPASEQPGSPLNVPVTLRDADIYVTRLKPDASAIEWSFYIGGTASERCANVLLDSLGDVYIFGSTNSANFPVTQGAWKTTIDPSLNDEFAVKLDAQTGVIKASTYLGVTPNGGFAVDAAGGVYASGAVGAAFQPTPGAYLGKTNGVQGLYSNFGIVRLNASLTSVVYATYIDFGVPSLLQADASGNLIFAGHAGFVTPAPPFPALNPISGIDQSSGFAGGPFIAKLNAAGGALIYASSLTSKGGTVTDLQVDENGNAWIAGVGASDIPLVNPMQVPADPGSTALQYSPAFFAEIPPQGGSLLRSTSFSQPGVLGSTTFLRLIRFQNRLCFIGIGVRTQTAGGLVGANPGYGTSDLSCSDDAGANLAIKTTLPASYYGYTAAQPTPDGAILLAGAADRTFPTTPGVVQPIFGGAPYSNDPRVLNGGDAFLVRVSLANPVPQLTSVFPDSIFLNAPNGRTNNTSYWSFTLSGTGFAYGTDITWNGQPAASTFNSSTQIAVTAVDPAVVQPGPNQVGASLAGPGGGLSAPVTVMAYNPAPGGVFVSPQSVSAGSPETKVIISAGWLTATSVLTWNGSVRTANFVPASQQSIGHLELLLEPAELAQPSLSTITITNPGPGGGVSAPSYFVIQPASGAGVPALTGPVLFEFDESTPVPATLDLVGIGFAGTTVATWDGAVVPSTFVSSTKLTITPPPGGLSVLGAHDLQVSNGSLMSPKFRFLVVASTSSSPDTFSAVAAFDPTRNLLYFLTRAQTSGQPSDLVIYDAHTGRKIGGAAAVMTYPNTMALSDDGGYLYLGGGTTGDEIRRFNIATSSVDLNWHVPTPTILSAASVGAIATVPGSPQTLVVLVSLSNSGNTQIVIYDNDRPRPLTGNVYIGLGCCGYGAPLVTPNRIFLTGLTNYPCLQWMDFGDTGITADSGECGMNPPELFQSHGFAWLTDGTNVVTVNSPYGAAANLSTSPPIWKIDPVRRVAYTIVPGYYLQILQMDLDTLRQTTRPATFLQLSFGTTLFLGKDGGLTVTTPYWIGIP